jgi:hypothetical protein
MRRPMRSPRGGQGLVLLAYLYKPRLDLTDGVWLSDRVLVSDVIRRRLFSPSSSAWRQGRFASGFAEAPASLMWARLVVSVDPGIEIGLQLVEERSPRIAPVHCAAGSDGDAAIVACVSIGLWFSRGIT